jgi:hypothetical protein
VIKGTTKVRVRIHGSRRELRSTAPDAVAAQDVRSSTTAATPMDELLRNAPWAFG